MPRSTWLVPPDAVEVLPPGGQSADPDRWLRTRLGGIGGSDAATLAGCGFDTLFGLWLDKTGRRPPLVDNNLLARGRRLEPVVAQWFCDESGLSAVRTGTWARTDQPWMLVNPDRLVSDGTGLECKSVGEDWGRYWHDGPARHAIAQALWCIAVLDAPGWWIAAMMDRPPWFDYWYIDRDRYTDAIDRLVTRASALWHSHVVPDVPPPVDGSDATTESLARAYPTPRVPDAPEWTALVPDLADLRRRRRELKTTISAAEAALKKVENEIKAGIGDAEVGVDAGTGRPEIAWRARTRTNKPRPVATVTTYRQLEEL